MVMQEKSTTALPDIEKKVLLHSPLGACRCIWGLTL